MHKDSPLKRILSKRRHVNGTRPGITGEDPLSKEQNSQDQWEFPHIPNGLTKKEKRLLVAKVMKTAVLAIFKTHTYSFNKKFFLQAKGGPIGLRSTCAVARLVMMWWDDKLLEAMDKLNIKKVAGARYMDDIRIWLHAIRLGWRIVDGDLVYNKVWKEEEIKAGMTALQKTTEVLKDMMNKICGWLVLTMETEDMFGGVLPTLDLELWVDDNNKVLFSYYEKPMVPNMVIHKRSAIPESTRRATLNQELIRKMVNTSELVGMSKRLEIIDKYAKKLINSEYSVEYTRNAIVGGLKGYERLLSLSKDIHNPKWKPLHMPASWNNRNRRIAKMTAKTTWYKGKKEVPPPTKSSPQEGGDEKSSKDEDKIREGTFQQDGNQRKSKKSKKRGSHRGTITLGGLKKIEKAKKRKIKQKMRKRLGETIRIFQKDGKEAKKKGPPPPTRSVLFVDSTVNGELARRLMEAEKDLGDATGYRVRVAESAGDALGVLLPSTNPWGPVDCGRVDCVPCGQGDERRIDCRKRNILYENICLECNSEENIKGTKALTKGVYIGESSRSLHERAKEHVADREGMKEDSHMLKHWLTEHQQLLEPPKFKFRIIRSFQDPLTRQLAEAVRIERHGDGILNSKSEFNRCRVPRLKIDQEEWGMKLKEGEKDGKGMDDTLEREAEDSLGIKTPNKRKHGDLPKGRKAKKLRFAKLEGWGEGPSTGDDDHEQEDVESGHGTLGTHRGPGVGTRSGWKSSQGGTSIRTAVPEGCP